MRSRRMPITSDKSSATPLDTATTASALRYARLINVGNNRARFVVADSVAAVNVLWTEITSRVEIRERLRAQIATQFAESNADNIATGRTRRKYRTKAGRLMIIRGASRSTMRTVGGTCAIKAPSALTKTKST